jgi:hypothetical protein
MVLNIGASIHMRTKRKSEDTQRIRLVKKSAGAVGVVVVMMIAALVPVVQCQGADKPNVIVFQTDEHNFRTIGAYREHLSEKQAFPWGNCVAVTTPHIDSLADNGSIATKFYANTPVCAPARAAFVSGHYPQNTPVVSNGVHLDDDIITYSKVLKDAGYVTGFAGKWHLDAGKPGWEPSKKFGFTDNRYMYNREMGKMTLPTVYVTRIANHFPRIGSQTGPWNFLKKTRISLLVTLSVTRTPMVPIAFAHPMMKCIPILNTRNLLHPLKRMQAYRPGG